MKRVYLALLVFLSFFIHYVEPKSSFDPAKVKNVGSLYVAFPFQSQCANDIYVSLRNIEIDYYATPQKDKKTSQNLVEMDKSIYFCQKKDKEAQKENKKKEPNGEYFYLKFYLQYLQAYKKSTQALFEDYPKNPNIEPSKTIFASKSKNPKSSYFAAIKNQALFSQRELKYVFYENKEKIKKYHPAFSTEILALYGHSWRNVLPMFYIKIGIKQEIKLLLREIHKIPGHQQNNRAKTLHAYLDMLHFTSHRKTHDNTILLKEIIDSKKDIIEIFNAHLIYAQLTLKSARTAEIAPNIKKATEIFPKNDFLQLLKKRAPFYHIKH